MGKVDSMAKVVLVLLLVLMVQWTSTEASSFAFYERSGYWGKSATLNAFGCSNVPANTRAGYRFTYQGQTAAAYNGAGCTGVAQARFQGSSNAGHCTHVGWQSVFIHC